MSSYQCFCLFLMALTFVLLIQLALQDSLQVLACHLPVTICLLWCFLLVQPLQLRSSCLSLMVFRRVYLDQCPCCISCWGGAVSWYLAQFWDAARCHPPGGGGWWLLHCWTSIHNRSLWPCGWRGSGLCRATSEHRLGRWWLEIWWRCRVPSNVWLSCSLV